MEMGQSRDYEQTWSSLQRCVIMFPPSNGYINIECTLHEKSTIYTTLGVAGLKGAEGVCGSCLSESGNGAPGL